MRWPFKKRKYPNSNVAHLCVTHTAEDQSIQVTLMFEQPMCLFIETIGCNKDMKRQFNLRPGFIFEIVHQVVVKDVDE